MKSAKWAAFAALVACLAPAEAGNFNVWVVETSGDFRFSASANYFEFGINEIRPTPNLTHAGANSVARARIVTEALAVGSWAFTGERLLTVDGGLQWSGAPDAQHQLKITTLVKDLQNSLEYSVVSYLDRSGAHWGGPVNFSLPTNHVRWEDTIEFINGPSAVSTTYRGTNHYMNMAQTPEPATLLALVVGVGVCLKRIRR